MQRPRKSNKTPKWRQTSSGVSLQGREETPRFRGDVLLPINVRGKAVLSVSSTWIHVECVRLRSSAVAWTCALQPSGSAALETWADEIARKGLVESNEVCYIECDSMSRRLSASETGLMFLLLHPNYYFAADSLTTIVPDNTTFGRPTATAIRYCTRVLRHSGNVLERLP